MNRDQIENELMRLGQSMRPDQTLADSVMGRIARCAPPRARPLWRIPAAVALAASLLTAVLVIHRSRRVVSQSAVILMPATRANPGASPTLAQYQWACGQSSDVLDSLLQEQPQSIQPRVYRAGDAIGGNLNLN